jgi:imidazolonepropionase-like amidohydrolase
MYLKLSVFTFFALLLSPILFAQDLLITGVHVVSVETGQLLENRTIHVSNGKIKAIIPAGNLPQGSQSITQIDGKGGFVFPGLAEFHAHLPVSTDGSTQLQEESMWLYLANGVVRIRSMLGHSSHLELRERINSGKLMGPRIVISGPSFSATTVTDPQQAAERVREQKQVGYDHLKIHPGEF